MSRTLARKLSFMLIKHCEIFCFVTPYLKYNEYYILNDNTHKFFIRNTETKAVFGKIFTAEFRSRNIPVGFTDS